MTYLIDAWLDRPQPYLRILNRETGEPLVTIEERPAPTGGVEPERLSFTEDGEKIVRILARVGKEMPAATDFVGAVTIPEFDHRITSFVLRKLAD